MTCQTKLKTLVADNFLAYFKSHTYHLNVVGTNFPQYHSLMQEVYEYLWESHDLLSEQQRQGGYLCSTSLRELITESNLNVDNRAKDAESMLSELQDTLENLQLLSQILYTEAGSEGHGGLETIIGDYMSGVSKLCWKVKSCL